MATRSKSLVSSWWKGIRTLPSGDNRPAYASRIATGPEDVRAAQMLRFTVFNLELNEGLAQSFVTGLDADPFDEVCDHLVVEELQTRQVVGTYRLQTGATAAAKRGYYSEQEFEFAPYEPLRAELLELGRACVHKDHRNLAVLNLLWKGVAAYARERGARYLIGCSSLTSQDPPAGASMYAALQHKHLVKPEWRTLPRHALACPLERWLEQPAKVPKLLAAYLSFGAKICGPPAIDREFKTIDFLTFLDLRSLSARTVERYLS
jgi:putative hemolysin